jgi:hypothetical protein
VSQNSYTKTADNAAVTITSPVYNNSRMVVAGYTYNSAPWLLTPYLQVTEVPHSEETGATKATRTYGAALMGAYSFQSEKLAGVSLPARIEYISSTGKAGDGSVDLLGYGVGSKAYSLTITPTYQKDAFFARLEGSYVGLTDKSTSGGFGSTGSEKGQFRALAEVGVLF